MNKIKTVKHLRYLLILILSLTLFFSTERALTQESPVKAKPAVNPKFLKLEALLKENPDSLAHRELLAEEYFRAKQYDRVTSLLNPYTNVISTTALLNLASAFRAQKNYSSQVQVIRLVVRKDPESHQPHTILGHALLELAKNTRDPESQKKFQDEAIGSLRSSIRIRPDYKPAYDSLLNFFVENKNNYESRVLAQDMLKRFGQRPELLSELCRLYSTDNYLDQAIESCRAAIQSAPNSTDNHVYLALAYRDSKKESLAAQTLVKAAKKFPQSEFVQRSTGEYYFEQKNYPVAARYYQQAVVIEPKSAASHLGLAQSLFESEKIDESLPHFIKACELDSTKVSGILEAAAKVRQKGQTVLASKFSNGGYSCRAKGP